MKWTIGKKVFFSFGIVMLLVAQSAVIVYFKMAEVVTNQERARFHTQQLNLAYTILAATNCLNGAMRGFIIAHEVNDAQEIARLHELMPQQWEILSTAESKLQQLSPRFVITRDKELMTTMYSDIAAYRQQQDGQVAQIDRDENAVLEVRATVTRTSSKTSNKLKEEAAELVRSINRQAEEDGESAAASAAVASTTVIVCCGLVVVLGLAFAAGISRQISNTTVGMSA